MVKLIRRKPTFTLSLLLIIGMAVTLLAMFTSSQASEQTESILHLQHWKMFNGANIYYVQTKSLPIIDIRVAFRAGSAYDGRQPGLANLTNDMLGEGTPNMSADQIADKFDSLGAAFSGSAGLDMSTLSLRSLSSPEMLKPALSTFTAVLAQPSFPSKAFRRLQEQTLSAISQSEQLAPDVANKAFFAAVYGKQPYGHPVVGTKKSVKAISLSDVKAFYKKYYVGNNATMVIVGNVNRKQAEKIANQILQNLPTGTAAADLADAKPLAQAVKEAIKFPSTQTQIRIGQVGIKPNDPNYFPLFIGNQIFGGSVFLSRLFKQVRGQHGLSYSVYSYFLPLRYDGPFLISLQTRNQQAPFALKLTTKMLDDFVAKGPTNAELVAAKKSIIGSFPLRLSSNNTIANQVLKIGFYQLPLNYLDTYRDNVNAVSIPQIKNAFKKVIDTNKLVTIAVGNGKAV